MIEKSISTAKIAKGLLTFQEEIGVIQKTETNPFFKSKYADLPKILEEIKGPLEKAGLSFGQFPDESGLVTILFCGDEFIQSFYPLNPSKNDPQGIGSAITYARRYALCAILGLSVDDDDGNMATHGRAHPEEKIELPWIDNKTMESDAFKTFLKDEKEKGIKLPEIYKAVRNKYKVSKVSEGIIENFYNQF